MFSITIFKIKFHTTFLIMKVTYIHYRKFTKYRNFYLLPVVCYYWVLKYLRLQLGNSLPVKRQIVKILGLTNSEGSAAMT